KKIITHAHWTVNGVKMSKSLGNVISPSSLISTYGVDPVRYFLLSEGGLTEDGDFQHKRLEAKLKGELSDHLGNLLKRCTGKALNPQNILPKYGHFESEDSKVLTALNALPGKYF